MALSNRDNPQSGQSSAGKASGTAGRNSPDQSQENPGKPGTAWRELDDRDLHNAAVDRGITVNSMSRDELIAALEAYDRDGSQGADAPATNHPETIEQRAAEDDKRRADAQGG